MTSASNYGLTVVGSSGGEELVLCPFHHDNNASAWFNPKTELFYCAVCGFGLNGVQLAKRMGIEVERDQDESHRPAEDYDLVTPSEVYDLGNKLYHPYFAERNIGESTIERFGVRWKGSDPEAAVLPLTNLHQKVKGVHYRYHNADHAHRYKTLGEMFPVWPMHHLLGHTMGQNFLVTEGAWSAMRLDTYFVQTYGMHLPVLSTLGAKANKKIVDTLRPFNVVFLYDGDSAGARACNQMRKLAPWWHSFTLSVAPDEMNDQEIALMFSRLKQRTEVSHELL